jgi:hypothetical protein
MRTFALSALICLALVSTVVWPQSVRPPSDRDFVFTDEDGHLVIRFAGAARLNSTQIDEVSNAEFSRMVHDRLRADLQFEVEPRDPDWAASMAPQIKQHVETAGPDFSGIYVECRAVSCRVTLEQPVHWSSVPAHQAVLETVQKSLEAFIAARPEDFERVFMITAYYQEYQTSHIKAFLSRTGHALPRVPSGG